MMPVAEKKILMGAGKSALEMADTPGEDGGEESDVESRPSAAKKARSQADKVAFNFMQMLPQLYEEILHRTGARAVIDLTASDGVLALACLSKGVPYFGFCHNSSHVAALTRRLQSQVFGLLADEGLPFFNSALAMLLAADPAQGAGGEVVSVVAKAKAKAKAKSVAAMGKALMAAAKGRGKGRGKGKARGKKFAKDIEVGEEEEDKDQDEDNGGLSESEPDSPGV